MNHKIANKIKTISDNKVLWEVFPRINGHKHVVTSAVTLQFTGPETYMFAADEKGNIIDWEELPGSYRGSVEHKKCFESIGYNVNE